MPGSATAQQAIGLLAIGLGWIWWRADAYSSTLTTHPVLAPVIFVLSAALVVRLAMFARRAVPIWIDAVSRTGRTGAPDRYGAALGGAVTLSVVASTLLVINTSRHRDGDAEAGLIEWALFVLWLIGTSTQLTLWLLHRRRLRVIPRAVDRPLGTGARRFAGVVEPIGPLLGTPFGQPPSVVWRLRGDSVIRTRHHSFVIYRDIHGKEYGRGDDERWTTTEVEQGLELDGRHTPFAIRVGQELVVVDPGPVWVEPARSLRRVPASAMPPDVARSMKDQHVSSADLHSLAPGEQVVAMGMLVDRDGTLHLEPFPGGDGIGTSDDEQRRGFGCFVAAPTRR